MSYKQSANEALQSIKYELGEELWTVLMRKDWSDLMINSDGSIWLDTDKMQQVHLLYNEERLISAALVLASYLGKEFNEKEGQQLDGTIPTTGIRACFLHPPLVKRVSCVFRCLNTQHFMPRDLVSNNTITEKQCDCLIECIKSRKNIVFAGATGSGKTTIMNAFLSQIPESERILTIEDTEELSLIQPNKDQIYVNEFKSYQQTIPVVLRYRPDRLIIGEMRYGQQCLQTLKIWNTGHKGGLTTIHANSCEDTIYRMRQLCQEVSQMTASELDEMIKHIVDVVVFIQRIPQTNKRVVSQIKIGW